VPIPPPPAADESETEPLRTHVEHPLPAPADTWHGGPVETWHSLLDDEPAAPEPVSQPIGFAHNGFHVDHEHHLQAPPPIPDRTGRHSLGGNDDAGTYGKHSMRFRD
jgi:hypothetical protein